MNKNIKHLAALSLLAYADGKLHPDESIFLKSVAARLNIDSKTADEIIANPAKFSHDLPVQEIDKYTFLGDLINLVVADGKIDDAEIVQCKKLCEKLGFENGMVDGLVRKMKLHTEHGFDKNKITEELKSELNFITSKITKNDRYN